MAELMNVTQTLSSMEVAEMMNMAHKNILRKIEGRDENGKHIDGALDIISQAQLEPSDYFIKSFYVNSRGKQYPAYNCTRKGCEFLAHKFQGAKGIKFTIAYIERFHQMEEALKSGNMIAEGSSLELEDEKKYLAKYNRTWYDKEKWKMDKLCYDYGWDRKYMYHKILKELGDIYNLECLREMFYNRVGREAKYDMELVNHFPTLQSIATRYLDFLLDA